MKYLKLFVVLTVFISFSGCSKIAEELANDKTVLLTKKLWTFESISGYDDFNNQFFATIFSDMTYQFRRDGTYTAVILAQANDGAWGFNSDRTIITLEPGDVDAVEWAVVTLSDTQLIVTYEDADALSSVATLTFN